MGNKMVFDVKLEVEHKDGKWDTDEMMLKLGNGDTIKVRGIEDEA